MSLESDPPGPEPPDPPGGDEPLVQPAGGESPVGADEAPPAVADEGAPAAAEPAAPSALVTDPPPESAAAARSRQRRDSHNMLPGRDRRRTGIERMFVRLIATGGIVGVGVAIAAIMVSSKSQGWVVGLVVSLVSVVLAAILWSSRQL
jgi:hypothetical protein